VIRQVNGTKVQVGLVAWGKGCGAIEDGQQNPSLFVDLAKYSGWIVRAMGLARTTHNKSVPLR
jgi:secreted trypsin-like serine protease